MNAPVRESDDSGPQTDGPSKAEPPNDGADDGAPNWSRGPRQEVKDASPHGASAVDAGRPRGMATPPEPPWRRRAQSGVFAGDVAAVALRSQLALAPDRLPEPPAPASRPAIFGTVGRLAGFVAILAAAIIGYLWGATFPSKPPHPTLASDQTDSIPDPAGANPKNSQLAIRRVQAANGAVGIAELGASSDATSPGGAGTPRVVPMPPPSGAQSSRQPAASAAARRLTLNAIGLRHADEPAHLTISAADAGTNAAVVLGGLAPGSMLSAGQPTGPNTWRLSAEDFNNTVTITPPRGFLGTMDLTLELRLSDNTLADRKGLQLEWSRKGETQPPSRRLDPSEIAVMTKNGMELMASGDIAAARMVFQRAAEAGDARAAFALAETYDPMVLKKLGARGAIAPDVALAQRWYEKARDLGSTAAPERIIRLTRLPE